MIVLGWQAMRVLRAVLGNTATNEDPDNVALSIPSFNQFLSLPRFPMCVLPLPTPQQPFQKISSRATSCGDVSRAHPGIPTCWLQMDICAALPLSGIVA